MGNLYVISELEKKRDELLKNAEAIDCAIQILKGNEDTKVESPNQYPTEEQQINKQLYYDLKAGSVIEKVIALIKLEGRFLYRKEIIALAEEYKAPFRGSITSALSHANADPKSEIALYMYQGNAGVWGLKQWLINGHIMEGKEYIKNEEYEKK